MIAQKFKFLKTIINFADLRIFFLKYIVNIIFNFKN